MANKKMSLSMNGKQTLDLLIEHLDCDRPFGIKVAFAKGINNTNANQALINTPNKEKWTIPDNIIRDDTYLLFKHLIIEEKKKALSPEEIDKQMLYYIEIGLQVIEDEIHSLASLEDYRLKILQ